MIKIIILPLERKKNVIGNIMIDIKVNTNDL